MNVIIALDGADRVGRDPGLPCEWPRNLDMLPPVGAFVEIGRENWIVRAHKWWIACSVNPAHPNDPQEDVVYVFVTDPCRYDTLNRHRHAMGLPTLPGPIR